MLEAAQPGVQTAKVIPFPSAGRASGPVSPLATIAQELDSCSPELRELIRHACAYGHVAHEVTPAGTAAARTVLGECLARWTTDAQAQSGNCR